MGLLADQDGIYYRYINEKENWDEHLANTKNYIRENIKPDTRKNVAVLGSGWLLDVPIDYLTKNFAKVSCYDLRHPHKIVSKYADVSNLEFIEMDLTGGLIEKTYAHCSRWKKLNAATLLNTLAAPAVELPEHADCIISVNLLNQLDILIIEYIRKYYRLKTQELNTIKARIQQAHIDLLLKHNWCLITDYEEVHIGTEGNELNKVGLVHCSLPEGSNSVRWTWKFDTRKTYNPKWKTYMNVTAINK